MFDSLQPNNHLPLLPTDFNYDNVKILKAANEANKVLSKMNALATKLPERLLLLAPLLVKESVASSEIENINTTVFKVFEMEIIPEKQQHGPSKEVLNYRAAVLRGFEIVQSKGFLSTNDFVEIQSIIEPHKTGVRKVPVKIMNDTTKEVYYTPPEGEALIRDLLANLEKFINNHDDDIDALIKCAVFHYQFESIHPFQDGNGRVGRILMILYLVLAKVLDMPVLFLSGYIMKHKRQYYEVLRKANQTNDFTEVILFTLESIRIQAEVTTNTILGIEGLMTHFQKVMKENTSFYTHELVNIIFAKPFLTIEYLQKSLNLSARQTASKYLSQLVKLGLLKEQKFGKNKYFYSQEFLKLLS
jgi:Fic family protein